MSACAPDAIDHHMEQLGRLVELKTKTYPARVLVVDDENGPRQALRILLNEYYEVRTADNILAALHILQEEPIDVIISDIRMPNGTGLDLLRAVRQLNNDIQVILLTGYGQLSTAMEAMEHGAYAYMEKPFDHQAMLDKVRASLEKRYMERERRALERIALEANQFETLGHIITGALHDLGTPLSVLGSHLEILIHRPTEDEFNKRMPTMRQQVEHCNDLVRNTMNLIRHRPASRELVSLPEVARSCLDIARPLLTTSQVAAQMGVRGTCGPIVGDLVQIRQAILNLIYNAVQAMESQEDGKRLRVEAYTKDGMACVSIEDSGAGVPHEHQGRIFDSLYSTKGDKGTGLGLAVVRTVALRHSGNVHLEQEEGKGARFVLQFPLHLS
jgi:two-component system, sensor histidine kinase and response regulator